jgi:hypothetical protein
MISKIIIVYYDNDSRLGSYFSDCAEYAISFLEAIQLESIPFKLDVDEFGRNKWNSVYFEIKISEIISNSNAMLVIYSHGIKDAFFYQEQAFIQSNISIDNIENAIIYTNSCSTGSFFGKTFDKSGGTFIGYESDLLVPVNPYYRKIFIECDNSGIFFLFHKMMKLSELHQAVKNKFNHHIDMLYKVDYVIASYLQEARDNFVVLGQNLDRTII